VRSESIPDFSAPLSSSYSRTQTPSLGVAASVASVSDDILVLLGGGSIQVGQVSWRVCRSGTPQFMFITHVRSIQVEVLGSLLTLNDFPAPPAPSSNTTSRQVQQPAAIAAAVQPTPPRSRL